jgi:hypothetical protein
MKKNNLYIIILFLGFLNFASAQDSDKKVTINKNLYEMDFENGLFIRGKAIGGFFLEDWWMANLCGGLEYRFKKYHGIGLDYVFMEHFNERDTFDYVNQYETSYGFTQYDLRQYLTLDYRIYDQMKPTKGGDYFAFYGAFFIRAGNRRIWNEQGWHLQIRDVVYAKYRYFDFGMSIGLHYAFGKSGFGFDSNIGGFARVQEVYEEKVQDDLSIIVIDGMDDIKLKPVFRFNLYYLFGSRKYLKQLPK